MTKNIHVRKTASDHVVKEPATFNWSEMLRHAEDCADGLWPGPASASLILIAGRYSRSGNVRSATTARFAVLATTARFAVLVKHTGTPTVLA